jgi:hypothetical protein
LGAIVIIFCSPQPNGNVSRRSNPAMEGPMMSPITVNLVLLEPGTMLLGTPTCRVGDSQSIRSQCCALCAARKLHSLPLEGSYWDLCHL